MGVLDTRSYFPDCRFNELGDEDYFNKDKTFGHFADKGSAYVITDRNTPRPWLQFLCNDKIVSCVSNTGVGYLKHISGEIITKYWEKKGNYLTRLPNGKRRFYISKDGVKTEFFENAENFSMTVRPGLVEYKGEMSGIKAEILMFVPDKIPCECQRVTLCRC